MKYKLAATTINEDVTIKLKFEGDGWTTMTFQENYPDETTLRWWNVIIAGDWGQWSYGWGYSGMGKRSIYDFMLSMRDDYYLQSKFIGAEPKIFDGRKTATAMRKIVREEVPWLSDKERHEELMYNLREIQNSDTDRDFIDGIEKDLREVLGDDYWMLLEYSIHPRTVNFFKNIFPKFFPSIQKLAKQYKESV
jgi:hypothetical protein